MSLVSFLFSIEGLLFALILIIITYLGNKYRRAQKSPPGPWNLPVIGYLPWIGKHPHLTFTNLSKKYGNIFQIKLGNQPVVVLNGHQTVREALTGNTALSLADRPDIFIRKFILGNGVVLAKYGHDFKIRRKILIRALTLFANRTNQEFHATVENTARNLIDIFKNTNGQPYCPKEDINHAVGRIISSLCYGSDFIKYEENYHEIMKNAREFNQIARPSNIFNFFPWTQIFFKSKIDHLQKSIQNFHGVTLNLIKEHKNKINVYAPTDVAEAIIRAIEGMKKDGKDVVTFTDNDLATMNRELLGAGFATTSTTLQWTIIFMTEHQDIQKKVQHEIDSVIPDNIYPNANDRAKLPFTEATLLEIQRFASVAPLGVPRSANEDFNLGPYFIAKGTTILPNLWSAHHDTEVWENPNNFNPYRFLNSQENEIQSSMAEKIMPFGAGRRRCAGEIVARLELFIIFSILMQQCEFKSVPGKKININNYSSGIILHPNQFEVLITLRK